MQRRGFIVAAWEEARAPGERGRVLLTGRLENGESFAARLPAAPPALCFDAAYASRIREHLSNHNDARSEGTSAGEVAFLEEEWSDFSGRALVKLVAPRGASNLERELASRGLRPLFVERPRGDQTLAALGITGPLVVEGEPQPGRRVAQVFVEPSLRPDVDARHIRLQWLALDIETDREQTVTAVSLAGAGGPGEVLFRGPPLGGDAPFVQSFETEAALLAALSQRIAARDPDLITGWNVLDFDLDVLFKRHQALGVPFLAGRTTDPVARVGARQTVRIPGRAVIDGMRLVRGSGERFEEQSLEAVARAVLGEGKTVSLKGEAKLDELERLRRDEPLQYCTYCLRDSELVLQLLSKLGLDALTARRAALTGVPLELAWTSIPAFERIYGSELRARKIQPPERDLERRVSGAAGGTVLEAAPGLFANVLVFDFRSLYPSIIRTFNIDPLAYERALAEPRADDLIAPNGARFQRLAGILPQIIARYAKEREAALGAGDDTAAFVYKILQNSFYGVLGAPGCRYARTELAAAITSFGKRALTFARDFFEQRGSRVLYGDTDSVFVMAAAPEAELTAFGSAAAAELNQALAESIRRDHGVESFLRIRCDKVYRRFLIPRLRSDAGGGRGRAKGYAGLKIEAGVEPELEVRGMEAVRSDFTPLARRFQLELLELIFRGASEADLIAHCRAITQQLEAGALDAELVYRKSLRRSAEEYGSETPQVRAARMLGWTGQRGRIAYVMTLAGAEPLEARGLARLDYEHYLTHQLEPIALSVADALGLDGRRWLKEPAQLELF